MLRSSALYLGELTVVEKGRSEAVAGRSRFSGRGLKNLLLPLLHSLAKRAPDWVVMVPVRVAARLLRWAYHWRANPLRQALMDLAAVASDRSGPADPRAIYHRFLDNGCATLQAYLDLRRRGLDAALARVELPTEQSAMVERLLTEYEGIVLAVAHNYASAFAAARLNQAFPMLLVAKNSNTAARTRLALEMFERMRVQVLMVRGGNPMGLSRAIFRALGERRAIAATVDNVVSGAETVQTEIFGVSVSLSPWAANLAAKRGVPLVPLWFSCRGQGRVMPQLGVPLISADPTALVKHYAAFFEDRVLEDPASWAYLADKHWGKVLRRAALAL
ncbi:MAG: hypothetical protein AAGA68_23455 [Pseudomonadota bacterium]